MVKLAKPIKGSAVTAKIPDSPPRSGCFLIGLVVAQQKSQVKVRVLVSTILPGCESTVLARIAQKGEEIFIPNSQLLSVIHPRRRESSRQPTKLIVTLFAGTLADIFLVGDEDPLETRIIHLRRGDGRLNSVEDLMTTERGLEKISGGRN